MSMHITFGVKLSVLVRYPVGMLDGADPKDPAREAHR